MTVPPWAGRALHVLTAVLVVLVAAPALFAAFVLPYRYWDSLAFGQWSRSIAETGSLWANANYLNVTRPLFYVPQGLLWRVADEVWLGRVFSLAFAAALVVAVRILAGMLTQDRAGRDLMRSLSVALLLASAVFVGLAAAGMTDVPVAAAVAATGAAAWRATGWRLILVVGLCAAAAGLAKTSAFLGLASLAAALLVLRGRRGLPGVAGIAAGAAIALAYDAWQASRLDTPLLDLLRGGSEEYWLARGAAARWDALGRAEWLGAGIRLLVVYGLVHALARALGARPRAALATAAGIALVWSIAGPVVADGGAPYPFDGSVFGLVAWLVLAAVMVAAPFLAERDPVSRRTHAALLVWLAPVFLAWAWQRADEVRHLAPVWAPLILAAAAALMSASLALARLRPATVLAPVCAVVLLVVSNVPSVDGLGREGWRGLLELGPSGWSDTGAVENYAWGPFSYVVNLARENVGPDERVITSDGRLSFFFPGRVEVGYPRSCERLDGYALFVLNTAGESLELARREGQPVEPLGWLQCRRPALEMVGEHEGIYAAYVVGKPVVRSPAPEDCRITSYPGELVDAVFGDALGYADAVGLRTRALSAGFQGAKIERTGCSTFRVLVSGVPTDQSVQADFREEVESVGLTVRFEPAVRYPEVSADIAAVR